MALNPAFDSHSSRKLPLSFGYVLGGGDGVLSTIGSDEAATAYACFVLGEGEWDGPEMSGWAQGAHLTSAVVTPLITAILSQFTSLANQSAPAEQLNALGLEFMVTSNKNFHFHRGAWAIKGAGNAPTTGNAPALGGVTPVVLQQLCDQFSVFFPSVTPNQFFSGMAYAMFSLPTQFSLPPGINVTLSSTITGSCIWRATRCRTFDASGNFVSYTFTCNPAWIIVEAILRYKIKPQQPPIAGLTPAEKACFNWPSIVAFAARNDFILPNGNPRFFWSGVFAADATLANIMETLLRCSRAYHRFVNGQLYLIGDDSRAPVGTLSANHLVPGTFKLSKKNVSKSPNQFVPRYRDIDVPAVTIVSLAATQPADPYGEINVLITGTTVSPFLSTDVLVYGGCSNPSLDGCYIVTEPKTDGVYGYLTNQTLCLGNTFLGSATGTGGYLGSNDARFSERAPTGVQHRSHQKMTAQQAPGLSPQPKVVPVYYDMGNSTFDQTNRVMKFERDSSLGPDTGASWVAPIAGTLTVYLEAVDSSGSYIKDWQVHDVIAIDDWLSPEFQGQYVIKSKTVNAPSDGSLATVDLELMQYFSTAYTDVSDDPGDAYTIVPGTTFQLSGFAPVVNPAWPLIATPIGVLSGSGSSATWTITIPNLVMQIGGVAGTTAYPAFSVAGIPNQTNVVLYIDDPGGDGVGATYGFAAGTTLTAPPAGRWIVLIGQFTNVFPFNVTPGDPSVLFEPA
jgi:hypothetical protein